MGELQGLVQLLAPLLAGGAGLDAQCGGHLGDDIAGTGLCLEAGYADIEAGLDGVRFRLCKLTQNGIRHQPMHNHMHS